ncbi:hypothetical protein [Sphingomonas palmae]|nr:hypothetical protein [Sphingomonas palmae]
MALCLPRFAPLIEHRAVLEVRSAITRSYAAIWLVDRTVLTAIINAA